MPSRYRQYSTRQTGGIAADIPELKRVMQDLKRLAPEAAKATRNRFRAAAKAIAMDARRRAKKRTGKLSKSITPRVSSNGSSSIVASAPHARINEFGGRHPVFGHYDTWVAQPAAPFMFPAVEAGKEEFFKQANEALNDAAREIGFQ